MLASSALVCSLACVLAAQVAPLDAARARAIGGALAGSDARLFPSPLTVTAEDVAGAPGQVVAVLAGLADPASARGVVERDELRRETLLGALACADVVGGVTWLVLDDDGRVRVLGQDDDARAYEERRAREKPSRPPRRDLAPLRKGSASHPFGAPLLGLRIAISPGHGWIDSEGDGTYATQRSNYKFTGCGSCRGILEDFFTSETVMDQVVPLLQSMGATVLLVREGDHGLGDENGEAVTVDDGDALYAEAEGTWSDGNTPGVALHDDYRVNAEDAPGRVVYTIPPLPRASRVSLRWPEGTNRTASAVVSIVHEGGVRTVNLDQREMGRLWLDLGAFPFGSGGAVEVAHGPSPGVLIADAAKIGGGLEPVSRTPWWQMGALHYVPFAGAPSSVTQFGDVSIRPAYAETLEPDVFVSIHANASGAGAGSMAHGTSTYRYSCGVYGDHTSSDGASSCDDPGSSRDLLDEVHASILAAVRADWDAAWADRGRLVADFGELRTLDDTPGILVETGFFDNLGDPGAVRMSDNQALHDPRFREAFARGLVGGIARFLAPGTDAPPRRPLGLRAINESDGTLRIAWDAVAGADGYRVVKAPLATTRGRGFDEGTVVTGATELVLGDGDDGSDGLVPGEAYAFRVSAGDENGESYLSQAVVARFRGAPSSDGGPAAVLVIGAYDRKDAFVQTVDNDDMAVIEHGIALAAATTTSFDGALDEAVESGAVTLFGRRLIDVVVGKDSTEHDAVSSAMRASIETFLDEGGAVILSGEEIGYAMIEVAGGDAGGDADDNASFFSARFGAIYVEDDAETFELFGIGDFAGIDPNLDDGSALYEVVFPDVWQADSAARPDALVALTYPDASGALIVTDQTALAGAGLEALVDDSARAALFAALLDHLAPGLPAEGEGEGEGEEGEGEGEGEGEEGEGEEGEGEPDIGTQSELPPSVEPGCGCASSASSSPLAALAVGLVALARMSRRIRRPM